MNAYDDLAKRFAAQVKLDVCVCTGEGKRTIFEIGPSKMSVIVCEKCGGRKSK